MPQTIRKIKIEKINVSLVVRQIIYRILFDIISREESNIILSEVNDLNNLKYCTSSKRFNKLQHFQVLGECKMS